MSGKRQQQRGAADYENKWYKKSIDAAEMPKILSTDITDITAFE